MAERNLNIALKKRLINNEAFVYAHLIKYERPYRAEKSGRHSTDAKRYAYLTDGAVNIDYDDGSFATNGTTANGTQTYIADKISKIGSYSETIEAKATGMTLTLSAESLYNNATDSMQITGTTITASNINFIENGFREGDKVLVSSGGGSNTNSEFRVTGIKTSGKVLTIAVIDTAVSNMGSAASTTLQIVSDEMKGPLLEMNDGTTLKSYHNRDVFIYKAFLDPDDYTIIGAPTLVFKGIIASASIKDDPNKNITVQWKLTSHWGDFAQVNGRPTNDAIHRAIDKDGVGQPDVALKEIYANDFGFAHADVTLSTMSTYKYMEKVPDLKKERTGLFGLRRKYTQVWKNEERTAQVDLNWALSAKYLPVVYGVDLVDGIPIFVDTENTNANAVYIAYAICEGEIGGIYDFYLDDHPRVCLNLEDSDARKGVITNGTNGTEEDPEVVCVGRADQGTVLGGTTLINIASATAQYWEDYADWLESVPAQGGGGPHIAGRSAAANTRAKIAWFRAIGADLLDKGLDGTADTGILHEEIHSLTTPNKMQFVLHSGLTHQRADDVLNTIANGDDLADDGVTVKRFKRQTDYHDGGTYWSGNHTLSDTAYVLLKCTIGIDDESVPETKYVVRGKLIDCHNYDFSYKHNSLPLYQYGGGEAELADGNVNPSQTWNIGDTVDLYKPVVGDDDVELNADVIIIDKWQIVTNQGTLEWRFRFSDAPELTYVNGVPTVTSFYMLKGSNKFHFVTSNHIENSGTVDSTPLTAEGRTRITSNKPDIQFSSAPTWVYSSSASTFPTFNDVTDELLPVAFLEDYTYEGNSYATKWSAAGTILTFQGVSKNGYTYTHPASNDYNVTVIRTDAIKLASSAGTDDDIYNGMRIKLIIADGEGDYTVQERKIIDYDGGTRTAQVNLPWDKDKFPEDPRTEFNGYSYTYEILAAKDERVSTNPAIQLLDYATSETYGKRLDLDLDIELGSWLSAARTCDSRGTQTCHGTRLIAAADDRYVLTHDGAYNGNIIAMGKVKTAVTDPGAGVANSIEFEEVYGKFTKTLMINRHSYQIGDIICNYGGYYRVGTAGVQPKKTRIVAATTTASTTVTVDNTSGIQDNDIVFGYGIKSHVLVSGTSVVNGNPTVTLKDENNATVSLSLVAGARLYFCRNLTRLTSFNIHKLGATDNSTALALTRQDDGENHYIDTTEYGLYNSDFIKYWRQLGWESHHQRWATRHQLCTTLDTSNSVFNNMNGMLQQFNGILSFEAGKYALRIETESDNTETLPDKATSSDTGYTIGTELNHRYITDDNIIGSIKVTDPGPKKSYNTVSSTIKDPGSKFEGKQVSFYDSDFLKADKNVIKSGNFAQASVHNYYNARINVENYLQKSRYQMKISFTLGPRGLLLIAGDVISITYPKFGWNQKQFRIENLNFKTNCTVAVSASEYDDSFYTITVPTLESNQISDSRSVIPYTLSPPSLFTASVGAFGQVNLVWKNAANIPNGCKAEIFYATEDTEDLSKRVPLAEVIAHAQISKTVNDSNWTTTSVTGTLDDVENLYEGMLVKGTTTLDAAAVTISSISNNDITLSATQVIPDNTVLTFINTGVWSKSFNTDASDYTFWIRHSYKVNGKTYNSAFVRAPAVTTVMPSTFYQLIVQASRQSWTANSAGAIQSPDYIKFTPDTNLGGTITWETTGDADNDIPIYTTAAVAGGESDKQGVALTNTTSIYLRKADVTRNGTNVLVSVIATITPTPAEIANGATNANYVTTLFTTQTNAGGTGTAGLHNAIAYLYKINNSNSTPPTRPDSGSSVYTFATGVLTETASGDWDGWLPVSSIPAMTAANPYRWVTAASASSNTTTDTIQYSEWATPVLDDAEGYQAATVYLYQRTSSATSPDKPNNSLTWTFADGEFTVADGHADKDDWKEVIPTSGGDYIHVITAAALAINSATTDSIAEADWSTPTVFAQKGDTGTTGLNQKTVSLYYLNNAIGTTPTLPNNSLFWNFDNKHLVVSTGSTTNLADGHASLDSWTQAFPPTTDTNGVRWVTMAVASANSSEDTIAAGDWAAPVVVGDDKNIRHAQVDLYQRDTDTTPPADPDTSLYWNFDNGNLVVSSGSTTNIVDGNSLLDSWTQVIPTTGDEYIFKISATALGNAGSTEDEIETGDWSAASLIAVPADDGDPGLRTIQGYLYYEKETTPGTAPLTPDGTTIYTFSTGKVTGGSGVRAIDDALVSGVGKTDKWRNSPNTNDATSDNTFWTIRYYGTEAAAESDTITVSYSDIVSQTNFEGVVTFSSGTFDIVGGSNITTIDGENITTGSIKSVGYSGPGTDGSDFSTTGTKFTLSGSEAGAITSEEFRIDTSGNAAFKGDISAATGTLSNSISIGSSDAIFIASSAGIQLGDADFADADFSVTPAGILKVGAGTVNYLHYDPSTALLKLSGKLSSGSNAREVGINTATDATTLLFAGGSNQQAPFYVDENGNTVIEKLTFKDADGQVMFNPDDGFTAGTMTAIATALQAGVQSVEKTTRYDKDTSTAARIVSSTQKITLTSSANLTVKAIKDGGMFGESISNAAGALAQLPTVVTFKAYYSTDVSDLLPATQVGSTITYTRVLSGTPGGTEYKVSQFSESEPFGFNSYWCNAIAGGALDSSLNFTPSFGQTGTLAADDYYFWIEISGTGPASPTSQPNNILPGTVPLPQASRTINVSSGSTFYVDTAGTGSSSSTDTDTTYTHTWVDDSDDAILRLTAGGSGSGNDDLTIVAGANITLTPSGDNLTIAASGGGGSGTVDTSGTPADNDFAKFTDADTIEGRSYSQTKEDLSLNNVENTALSTWAGTSNITTLGTIGTGVWSGTALVSAKIGNDQIDSQHYAATSIDNEHLADDAVGVAELSATGTASSSTFLRGDNTWSSVSGASGGTVTSVTAGTGMTQSGSSTVNPTLNVIGGTGITANANDIAVTTGAVADGATTTIPTGDHVYDYIEAQGFGTGSGDITAVVAGTGMSGGATSGSATLNNAGVTSIVAGSNISISGATGAVTVTGTDTNTQLSDEQVQDIVGAMTTGNTESGITVAYQDGDGTIDFTVGTLNQNTTGTAGGLSGTPNITVGTLAATTGTFSGAITSTGNITAYYSDERLKRFEGKIENALDKVTQLNGYYFKENDLAKKLGYNNERLQVGISAQEVEAVLPEVVTEAPIDPEYKTVWYEKIVPLLIEAIKELKEEVDTLKGK